MNLGVGFPLIDLSQEILIKKSLGYFLRFWLSGDLFFLLEILRAQRQFSFQNPNEKLLPPSLLQ